MQHRSADFQLRDLVAMVAANKIALPEFQRPFVWNPNAVLELIDSLANGWPIGSLLLLEGPQAFAVRGISGGPTLTDHAQADSAYEYLVLDGQQRITALYHCFADRGDVQYLVHLGDNLHEEASAFSWRRRSNRATDESTMPLGTALDDRYFSYAVESFDTKTRDMFMRNRRDRLGQLVSSDRVVVPAIVLQRGIDLEALTRIFETLNRTGTPLDAFDLMVSLLYPEGFHLRDALVEAKKHRPILARFDVPGIELLKSIALLQRDRERRESGYHRPAQKRVKGIRQRDVLNTPPRFVVDQWHGAVESYGAAADWIRVEGGVQGGATLPSRAMLLTVAHALRHGVAPNALKSWYWQQIALQSYAQGANTQVLADSDALVDGSWTPAPGQAWRESLRAGLMDQSRRNRMLRLGLRGLMIASGEMDILSGKRLRVQDDVRELSATALANGVLAAPGKDALLQRLYVQEASYTVLQSIVASPGSFSVSQLNLEAVERQLVPSDAEMIFLSSDEIWARRLDYFENLFAARMEAGL